MQSVPTTHLCHYSLKDSVLAGLQLNYIERWSSNSVVEYLTTCTDTGFDAQYYIHRKNSHPKLGSFYLVTLQTEQFLLLSV